MSAIDSSRLHQCTAVRLNSIAPRVLQCMNSEAEYVPRIGVQGLSRPATLVDSFWKVFQFWPFRGRDTWDNRGICDFRDDDSTKCGKTQILVEWCLKMAPSVALVAYSR
jgi:hypothetical protein